MPLGGIHRIDLAKLPMPFATDSARNNPEAYVDRPADAKLTLPPSGFKIDMSSQKDLVGPRRMGCRPQRRYLCHRNIERACCRAPSECGRRSAASMSSFTEGLKQPFGIAFYPNAQKPAWLYVGETNRVVRYPFSAGDNRARAAPEVVVPDLPARVRGAKAFHPRHRVLSGRKTHVRLGRVGVQRGRGYAEEIGL